MELNTVSQSRRLIVAPLVGLFLLVGDSAASQSMEPVAPEAGCRCRSAAGLQVDIEINIPQPLGEGLAGAHGAIRCLDDRLVYCTDATYTSAEAAIDGLNPATLHEQTFGVSGPKRRVRAVSKIDSAYVVEFDGTARMFDNPVVDANWMVTWLVGNTAWHAFACDREIAVKFYENSVKGGPIRSRAAPN